MTACFLTPPPPYQVHGYNIILNTFQGEISSKYTQNCTISNESRGSMPLNNLAGAYSYNITIMVLKMYLFLKTKSHQNTPKVHHLK